MWFQNYFVVGKLKQIKNPYWTLFLMQLCLSLTLCLYPTVAYVPALFVIAFCSGVVHQIMGAGMLWAFEALSSYNFSFAQLTPRRSWPCGKTETVSHTCTLSTSAWRWESSSPPPWRHSCSQAQAESPLGSCSRACQACTPFTSSLPP